MKRIAVVLVAVVLTACSSSAGGNAAADSHRSALIARIGLIQAAITRWKSAPDLAAVKTAAETARNLVVGPHGPRYGDANGDGTVQGVSSIGLLPGLRGEAGLADARPISTCVVKDVLGGSWSNAARRWAQALRAVSAWTPSHNTFPTLQSQPQRIYGWASLALASASLSEARGYASDAQMHIDVTRTAVEHC